MRYDAFISYSHAGDDLLAERLQDGLQRFAKPWWRRRALEVFRDRTGLSANPGLWSSIVEAMEDSRFFVLLASREAAESVWVQREVSHWQSLGNPDKFLVVHTDGEMVWDDARGGFDPALTTALPAALLSFFAEEPRHVDMRWARSELQLDLTDGRFRDQIAELAAPLHGVAKEELAGEDVRQHRRTLRHASAAGVALVLLTAASIALGLFGLNRAAEARANLQQAETQSKRANEQAILASARGKEAQRNAAEAETNAQEAESNAEEAETNAQTATRNAAEASRQGALAEQNAAEAVVQQKAAELSAAEATRQQKSAELSAAEAILQQEAAEFSAAVATVAQRSAELSAAEAIVAQQAAELSEAEATEQRDIARDQTVLALSRQLAAEALSTFDARPDLALLEAVAAHSIRKGPDPYDSLLRNVIERNGLAHVLYPTSGSATRAAVSPDGRLVASANSDGSLTLWDRSSGEPITRQPPRLSRPATGLWFGPNNLLVAQQGTTVTVFAPTTGVTKTLESRLSARVIAISPNGAELAIGGKDAAGGRFEVWCLGTLAARVCTPNLAAGPKLADSIRTPNVRDVVAIAFSHAGGALGWAGRPDVGEPTEYLAEVRRLADGAPLSSNTIRFPDASAEPLVHLTFSADDTSVRAVGPTTAIVADIATGQILQTRLADAGATFVAASPDASALAAVAEGGAAAEQVRVIRLSDGAQLGDVIPMPVRAVAMAADRISYAAVDTNGLVRDVHFIAHQPRRGYRHAYPTSCTDACPLPDITLSHRGDVFALNDDNGLALYRTADGRKLRGLPFADTSGFFDGRLVFSTDDRFVAAIYNPNEIAVWEVATGAVKLHGLVPDTVTQIALGSDDPSTPLDDTQLAAITDAGGARRHRVWALRSGQQVHNLPLPPALGTVRQLQFDHHRRLVFESAAGLSTRFTIRDGARARSITVGSAGGTFAISPGDRYYALARGGQDVVIVDARNGKLVGSALSAANTVALAFSRDGTTLATGGSRGSVRLWDLASRQSLGPTLDEPAAVSSLAFGADGTLMSTGQGLRTSTGVVSDATEWKVGISSLLQAACDRANRELSPDEWNVLVGSAVRYRPVCAQFR